MKPVAYLPGAKGDFDESFDWYAKRSPLAAELFARAVDDAVRRITENPVQFAAIDALHRACLVERFPFRIVYRIEATRILLVAVAHAKRRPGYWKRRS